MRLKIYKCIGTGSYRGGMAIVAAENPIEACELASIASNYWHLRFSSDNCEELTNLRQLKKEKVVLAIFELGE